MPRTPTFERDEIVARATEVFWRRGYGGTTVSHLVAATGLRPGSLYGAFGSKKGIFLEVLKAYQEQSADRLERALRDSGSPLTAIRQFFVGLVREARDDRQQRGCLMVNTLLEYSQHDRDVRDQLSAGLTRVEHLFRRALEAARSEGELNPELDVEATAAFLVNNLWGIRVTCRGEPSDAGVQGVVDTVLAVLVVPGTQRGSIRRM